MDSEQLRGMVRDARIKLGKNGRRTLAKKAKCSPSTLISIERDGHIPLPEMLYQIALACDRTEDEALSLAREASGLRAMKAG